MREAVFAGEKIEKLAFGQNLAGLTSFLAELTGFPKNLFVGDGPGGAGDRQRKNEQRGSLMCERYGQFFSHWRYQVSRPGANRLRFVGLDAG